MVNLKDTIFSIGECGADNSYTNFMRDNSDHDTWIENSEGEPIDNTDLETKLKDISERLLSVFPDSNYGSIKIVPENGMVKIKLFYK